jgi:large subunit ribosomal protein L29
MKAKLEKLREQGNDDLVGRVLEIKESLFRLNFKKALGDTDTVKQLRRERKEMARLMTVLRARQLGIEKK